MRAFWISANMRLNMLGRRRCPLLDLQTCRFVAFSHCVDTVFRLDLDING